MTNRQHHPTRSRSKTPLRLSQRRMTTSLTSFLGSGGGGGGGGGGGTGGAGDGVSTAAAGGGGEESDSITASSSQANSPRALLTAPVSGERSIPIPRGTPAAAAATTFGTPLSKSRLGIFCNSNNIDYVNSSSSSSRKDQQPHQRQQSSDGAIGAEAPATTFGGGGGSGAVGGGTLVGLGLFSQSPVPFVPTSAGGRTRESWGGMTCEWSSDEDGGDGGGGESGRITRRRDASDATTAAFSTAGMSPRAALGAGGSGGVAGRIESGSIRKGGYLWKRSTNVRKDWKRRYFFMQVSRGGGLTVI